MNPSVLTLRAPWRRRVVAAFVGLAALTSGAVAAAAAPRYVESWVKQALTSAELTSSSEAVACNYGAALAVVGKSALVGGPACARPNDTTGEVFVFRHNGATWSEQTPISAPPGRRGFGYALAATAEHFAIASLELDVWGTPVGAQPVRIAPRSSPGAALDVLLPDAATGYYGYALALSGTTLAVADPGANDGSGAVAVYRLAEGVWSLNQTLPEVGKSLVPPGESFGTSVVLSGNRLFVSAAYQGGVGAVYAFERASATSGFEQVEGAIATPPGSGFFGGSIAFEPQTETLAIGDLAFNDSAGVVRCYRRGSSGWEQQGPGLDSATAAGPARKEDSFGSAIAFAGGGLFAGASTREADTLKGLLLAFSPSDPAWTAEGPLSLDDHMGEVVAGSPGGSVVARAGEQVLGFTLASGVTCSALSDCASGFCSDGVCCDSACDGICESCRGADTGAGDGACLPVPVDTDPAEECLESEVPCQTTGFCDGAAACQMASVGTVCDWPSCQGSSEVMPGGRCDGTGECLPLALITCSEGYECSEGACVLGKLPMTPTITPGAGGSADEPGPAETVGACDTVAGFYLLEGSCVVGPQCATQENVAYDADGEKASCGRYTCNAGACRTSCSVGRQDCAVGFVCDFDSKACVPVEAFNAAAVDDPSISCGYAHGHGGAPTWVGLSFLALLLQRRRLKRSRLAAFAS